MKSSFSFSFFFFNLFYSLGVFVFIREMRVTLSVHYILGFTVIVRHRRNATSPSSQSERRRPVDISSRASLQRADRLVEAFASGQVMMQ